MKQPPTPTNMFVNFLMKPLFLAAMSPKIPPTAIAPIWVPIFFSSLRLHKASAK